MRMAIESHHTQQRPSRFPEFIRKRAQLDQRGCELRKLQSACRPKQSLFVKLMTGDLVHSSVWPITFQAGTRLYTRNEK